MPSVPDLVAQVYENAYQTPHPELVVQVYENVGTGLPPQEIPRPAVTPPLCHLPHQTWAGPYEAENYNHIERWAARLHATPFPVSGLLHLPYKEWADPDEANNYAVMER